MAKKLPRYTRMQVGFTSHPKMAGLTDSQFRLWITSVDYCAQHLTDGVFPLKAVAKRKKTRDFLALYESKLWHQIDEKTARIHDYLDYQQSRAEVAELSEKRAAAVQNRWQKSGYKTDTSCIQDVIQNGYKSDTELKLKLKIPPPLDTVKSPGPVENSGGGGLGDFEPSESHRALAARLGVDLDKALDAWRYWRRNDQRDDWAADFTRALETWIRDKPDLRAEKPRAALSPMPDPIPEIADDPARYRKFCQDWANGTLNPADYIHSHNPVHLRIA